MKDTKKYLLAALLLVLAVVSIGYAALNANLNISGTATAKGNTWGVVLDNVANVTSGYTAPTVATNKLSATYSATLNKPKDVYEFDIDIHNTGSIAAKLNGAPQLTGTNTYMKHTVVNKATGAALTGTETIAAGGKITVHVKVEYLDSAVPAADSTANFGVTFDVVQN